jgi:hypothetical protein
VVLQDGDSYVNQRLVRVIRVDLQFWQLLFLANCLLGTVAAQAQSTGLEPLTVPPLGVGACVVPQSPRADADPAMAALRRYALQIDRLPAGQRTITIALDSLGTMRSYIEHGVAMLSGVGVSTSIAAGVIRGEIGGFLSVVRSDSTTERSTLDLNQQRAILRVTEAVRQRCETRG